MRPSLPWRAQPLGDWLLARDVRDTGPGSECTRCLSILYYSRLLDFMKGAACLPLLHPPLSAVLVVLTKRTTLSRLPPAGSVRPATPFPAPPRLSTPHIAPSTSHTFSSPLLRPPTPTPFAPRFPLSSPAAKDVQHRGWGGEGERGRGVARVHTSIGAAATPATCDLRLGDLGTCVRAGVVSCDTHLHCAADSVHKDKSIEQRQSLSRS